ncbi:MAG: hypothetical protein IIC84_07175, partial [Chloroflexi bacterium]|nr:hypothetical protein [Chloroflexota bacterium]
MMNMLFAEMSSSGYWYHDAIMSTWILALRAEGKRSTHHSVVKHHIETKMKPFLKMTDKQFAPSPNIARGWKDKFPDLPEQAWNHSDYEEDDLPTFARHELNRE